MKHALWLLLVLTGTLAAQIDRASMTGTVIDPSKAVVQGATVTLKSSATGIDRVATTNGVGAYSFSSLPVGQYTASVAATGFQTLEFAPFNLEVGETRTVNATLAIGAVGASVQVTEASADLNQSSAEIGGVIQGAQVQELPMNGRSFVRLMSLVPGAIDDGGSTQDQIRFAGLSQEDNNFQMDGVDAGGINHQFEKVDLRLQIPVEAIAEFRASSAMFSADQGGSAGGQVQIVTKSGSNTFHGAAWEFLRNSMFDARPWGSVGLPQLQLNNFGANLGGAILKNKLFFFSNWEAYRQVLAQQVTGLVPTVAYRAAVIEKSPSLAPIVNSFVSGGSPTKDPNALSFSGAGRNPVQEDSGMTRVDYNINSKTNLFGRFSTDHYSASSPNGVQVNSSGQLNSAFNSLTSPNAVIDLQRTFTSSLYTDLRFGFNRDEFHEGGNEVLPFSVSFSNLFSNLSLPATDDRYDTSYSLVDDTTFVWGRHTFKAGLMVRRVQENKNTPRIPVVTATYLNEANFMNNVMDSYQYQGASAMTGQRQTQYGAYFMDEIKVRPNLTINAGLRYDYWSVDHDVFGRGIAVDPNTCPTLVCPPGSAWYNSDPTNLGPRLSVAWSPAKSHGKTVIRAGGGIFYGQGQFGHLGQPVGNIPSQFTLNQKQVPGLSYPVTPYLGAAVYSVTYTAQDRNRKNLAVDEWSASIQHELAKDTTLQVSYVGSKGSHLWTNSIVNSVNPVTGLRPYTGFAAISYFRTDGISNYNALEVGLHRNLSTGLLISANYQWSHALDDGAVGGAEATTPQNIACRSCEYASSQFDMRSYFTSSAIWRIPIGKGHHLLGNAPSIVNALLGGWQLAGVGTARSGLPLNVTISRAATALPDQNNGSQRPNVVSGQSLYPVNQTPSDWLNLAAFSTPASGTWGNAGRNLIRAPGHWQIDMALEKRIQVWERLAFTFRAEAFNVFNVTQYGNPGVSVSSSTYGLINSAFSTSPTGSGTPREIELSLRLDF
jgi:Carboxypeptidase regulatory-like domain/TonB dependent receptor-like, beta-barrel